MGLYDRGLLQDQRSKMGRLLEMDDAIIIQTKDGVEIHINCLVEFRGQGIIFFSKTENFSDWVWYNELKEIKRDPQKITINGHPDDCLGLVYKDEHRSMICFWVPNVDYFESGLLKLLTDSSAKETADAEVNKSNIVAKMRQLKELYTEEMISETEYERLKAALLDQLSRDGGEKR